MLSPSLGWYCRLWHRVVVPASQRLHRLAARYNNPLPESTISSSQGKRIWPLAQFIWVFDFTVLIWANEKFEQTCVYHKNQDIVHKSAPTVFLKESNLLSGCAGGGCCGPILGRLLPGPETWPCPGCQHLATAHSTVKRAIKGTWQRGGFSGVRLAEFSFKHLKAESENQRLPVRDLWGTNFCKTPRKSASLPCPFKMSSVFHLQITQCFGIWT